MKLGIPVLIDRNKEAYRAFGFDQALGLIQQSATVVLSSDGRVMYAQATYNPAAAFNKTEVFAVLEGR